MVIAIGVLLGLVMGLTGAGGSVFALPLLMLLLDMPLASAVACSLITVCVSACVGAVANYRAHNVLWVPALCIAIAGMLTAPLGKLLGDVIPDQWVLLGFCLLASAAALRMWPKADSEVALLHLVPAVKEDPLGGDIPCRFNPEGKLELRPRCLWGMVVGGLLVGLMSGVFGVGGGFLIVPLLRYQTGVSMRFAAGTSLCAIALISSVGFVAHLDVGVNPPVEVLVALIPSAVMGLLAGIKLLKYFDGRLLQQIFSITVLMIVVATLWVRL